MERKTRYVVDVYGGSGRKPLATPRGKPRTFRSIRRAVEVAARTRMPAEVFVLLPDGGRLLVREI